ncbi:(2Fe-2S)-binding protein [Streptomyces sp. NPDC004134]|uniref:(2Fe-2S)-binding protein n=1 Tax=Streptomyces sp. NPDC004134 TaxID=3364691 RepID=UPI0036B08A9F
MSRRRRAWGGGAGAGGPSPDRPPGAGERHPGAGPAGRGGDLLIVRVDGEELVTESGRTVAGLLLALGRVSWRTTRGGGRPRGVFCGIGVCHDCLVVVNGAPDVRACQRLVRDGDDIRTQDGAELPA